MKFRAWGNAREVAQFIRELDVLILLTRNSGAVREQFGRVITEAHACGVSVIGSTSGAIPSVIGPGGWVVPEHDPAALARLLVTLIRNPEERAARGQNGIENVNARFTQAVVAQSLAASWLEAVATGASPLQEPGQALDCIEIPKHRIAG